MAPLGCFVKLKSDLTERSLDRGLGWLESCDPGLEPNYYFSVNCFNLWDRGWEEGRGDTEFQENRKEEVYGEVLYKFTNIQKQKQKKHIFQIKMTTSFIWQKVVYT